MTPREDETYRSTRYGGHPPACTCVSCCEERRAGKKRNFDDDYDIGSGRATPLWFWAVIIIVVVSLVLTLILR